MKAFLLILPFFAFGEFASKKPTCEQQILESFQPSDYCCYDDKNASFKKRPEEHLVINFVLDVYKCKYSKNTGKLHLSGMFWNETELGNIKTTNIKPVQNVTIFKGVERDDNLYITDTVQVALIEGEFSFKTKLSTNENVYIEAPSFGQYVLKLQ